MRALHVILYFPGLILASPGWIDRISEGKGLLIALIGMGIVFSGLVLISLMIGFLTRILEERRQAVMEEAKPVNLSGSELTEEEILAITTAINLCSIYIEGEKQRLTWEDDQPDQSSWSVAGRAQTLAQRSNISHLKG